MSPKKKERKNEKKEDKKADLRPYRVYSIKDGTVIDHIPAGMALKVIEILGVKNPGDTVLTVGVNMESKKHGRKDVVKIENKTLTTEELNKTALIAPTATINIIKNHTVARKWNVEIPDEVRGFVVCANPSCITRQQDVESRFHVVDKKEMKVKCHYCERVFLSTEVLG